MVRVLLSERDGPVGNAIRSVVNSIAGWELVWDVPDIPGVLRVVGQENPDVILLPHSLMANQFVSTLRTVVALSPGAPILVLAAHNDSRLALRAIEAGASGYLLQERAFEELEIAVKTVMSGRTYLSPGIAGMAYAERGIRGEETGGEF